MKIVQIHLSEKALKEVKRQAKLDDRSMKSWLQRYMERTFAGAPAQPPNDPTPYFPTTTTPVMYPAPVPPYTVGDVPGQPEITCAAPTGIAGLPENQG